MKIISILGMTILYLGDENYGDNFKFQNHSLDLHINLNSLSVENIDLITTSLNELKKKIDTAYNYLLEDFKRKGETQQYIDEWITYYLDEECFKDLVPKPVSHQTPNLLFNKFKAVSVSMYAWSKKHPYIIIDFAFGFELEKGFRDNMVVIKMDKDYKLLDVTTEG